MASGRSIICTSVIATALASCVSPNEPAAEAPRQALIGSDASGEAPVTCSNVHPPAEPSVMAWDAASRASLSALRANGLIAVHYQASGCDVRLELLPKCTAPGAYRYSAYSANESKVATNASELYVQLPIGAAQLSSRVAGDRALRIDSMLTGSAAVPPGTAVRAADLQGEGCERATHVVSAIYLGGFSIASGATAHMEGPGNRFAGAVPGKNDPSSDQLASEGNPEACRRAQASGKEDPQCDVPLRVALLSVAADSEGASASATANASATKTSVPAPTVAAPTVCLPPHTPSAPPPAAIDPALALSADRDGDGIGNGGDACPDDAGPQNSDPKLNGCPNVFLRGSNLIVMRAPTYETASAKLSPESVDVLTQVANVLKRHPEIQQLAIEVWAAPSADAGLSQRRANAVRAWLRAHGGIDRSRLNAVGQGACAPTDTAVTEQGRTEFHVVGLQAR